METITGFSKYFTFEELTDSDSRPDLVKQNRIDAMKFIESGRKTSMMMEEVRHEVYEDKPSKVKSGYRNPILNKAIGSIAKKSTHMEFEAVDNIPPMPLKEAFTKIITAQKAGKLPKLRKVIREDHKGILHIEAKMSDDEKCHFYTTSDNKTFKEIV